MAYISNEEIETRLGSSVYVQLTDDAGTGSADEAVVDEARAGAEGEVDAYLARRFAVPIDLAALPHVDSSYNPDARSHLGASGIWQFTRSTGRRFKQIDLVLD